MSKCSFCSLHLFMNRIMYVLQCLLQIRSGGRSSISDAAVSDDFL
jgi:hypothetical protein